MWKKQRLYEFFRQPKRQYIQYIHHAAPGFPGKRASTALSLKKELTSPGINSVTVFPRQRGAILGQLDRALRLFHVHGRAAKYEVFPCNCEQWTTIQTVSFFTVRPAGRPGPRRCFIMRSISWGESGSNPLRTAKTMSKSGSIKLRFNRKNSRIILFILFLFTALLTPWTLTPSLLIPLPFRMKMRLKFRPLIRLPLR